jgi:hypothetical protein
MPKNWRIKGTEWRQGRKWDVKYRNKEIQTSKEKCRDQLACGGFRNRKLINPADFMVKITNLNIRQ